MAFRRNALQLLMNVAHRRPTIPMMQPESGQLLQRLKPLFQENFERFGELGAAVSVWQNGKPILDLCGGFRDARRESPWAADTLVLVWSATKGIGCACVLHALQEHNIDINQRVAKFWPEFAQVGKEEITFAQLLSHQTTGCRSHPARSCENSFRMDRSKRPVSRSVVRFQPYP